MSAHPTPPSTVPPVCRLKRRCATKKVTVHCICLPLLDDDDDEAAHSEQCSFRNCLHMDKTTKLRDFGPESFLSLSLVLGDDTFPAQEGDKFQTPPETKNQAIHARFPRLKQRKLAFNEFFLIDDDAVRKKSPQTPPSQTNRWMNDHPSVVINLLASFNAVADDLTSAS